MSSTSHPVLRQLIAVLAVVSACVALLIAQAGRSLATEPSSSLSTQPQAGQSGGSAAKAGSKGLMETCLASWDRATQMSKQEWKETCKRTVREYPDAFRSRQ